MHQGSIRLAEPGETLPAPAAATVGGAQPALLSARGVTKTFPGVTALDQVDFDLRAGEVHVLFGENGAGKSTLISIIAGALRPNKGELLLDGAPLHLQSVDKARRAGISAVFQEFSLAPDLAVEENLFLGTERTRGQLLDKRAMHRRAQEILKELEFPIDPRALVSRLSRAERQMVEIAKALLTHPRILILDEPTSSLTESETSQLFDLIARLKAKGVGIIYISHRIKEIQTIGDRITVMRDGRYVATLPAKDVSKKRLVELMTGRPVGALYPTIAFRPAETLLAIDNLATDNKRVVDISIELRAGEIVGLAGLVGCGKSEIGRACFGIERIDRGTIRFLGKDVLRPTPRAMLDRGLVYLPSDRVREGLMIERPTRENISLPILKTSALSRLGLLRRRYERRFAQGMIERMGVRPPGLERPVIQYSGGNQQKILLGKSLASDMRVLILDEPTIGVDVGAKTEIYGILKSLTEAGVGILLISSDLPEVLGLSNRVYVIYRGHRVEHLDKNRISEENVLAAFFGKE